MLTFIQQFDDYNLFLQQICWFRLSTAVVKATGQGIGGNFEWKSYKDFFMEDVPQHPRGGGEEEICPSFPVTSQKRLWDQAPGLADPLISCASGLALALNAPLLQAPWQHGFTGTTTTGISPTPQCFSGNPRGYVEKVIQPEGEMHAYGLSTPSLPGSISSS